MVVMVALELDMTLLDCLIAYYVVPIHVILVSDGRRSNRAKRNTNAPIFECYSLHVDLIQHHRSNPVLGGQNSIERPP